MSPSNCILALLRQQGKSYANARGVLKTYAGCITSVRDFNKDSNSKNLPSKPVVKEKENAKDVMDRLGTWDNRIEFPLQQESSIRRGTLIPEIKAHSVGVCTEQGRRAYQEDRFTVVEHSKDLLLLAVWDGHGGGGCSEFCSKNVQGHLDVLLAKHSNGSDKPDLGQVLNQLVLDLNSSFEKHWRATMGDARSPGTTATIALIRDSYELVIAQCGDSRAVLCRDGLARPLTTDHCPSIDAERLRIESNGGKVSYDTVGRYMVNNRLSMSRSIGDLELKKFGVTCEPELIRKSIKHGKDKYLVLLTDGITFVMTNEEIVEVLNSCEKPKEAAAKLVDQALHFASEDNCTVLVVPLGSWGKGDDAKTSMLYSIGRNMALTSRFS